MGHAVTSLRFLLACAVIAMAPALRPAVSDAQQCVSYADCSCTPLSDGMGS